MKALKWIFLLPMEIFPYSFLMFVNVPQIDVWKAVGWFWLAGLAGDILLLFFEYKGNWDARSMARVSMAAKLFHTPAYLMWFLLALFLFIFLGPVLAFTIDAMTIILSGLLGLAAVLRCKKEGVLTGKQAVLYGILQFVFCADVISAVILYRKTREVSL